MTSFSMTEADIADQAIITASEALGAASRHVMTLEDERPLQKAQATKRIMARDNIAATRAEAIVESDDEYMALRRQQYDAVVAEARAKGVYQAACNRARRITAIVVAQAEVVA